MKTKFLLPLLFSILVFHKRSYSQCQVLVWSDEFDGTGLPNSAFWGYDFGANGWGNNEVQNYTNNAANVRQENGSLVIEAIKSGSSWTSARVKSQGKKIFRYGKIIFRAKLPTGVGTWPALWMLGENISSVGWPACGEIDIMEHVGKNQNVVQAALHTPSSFGDTQNKASTTIATASTEFHDYAISWNAERMIFSVDDIAYYIYNPSIKTASNWPYDASQFIIMNIAMGGTLGGSIDATLTSAKMEIDYVRLYEERTNPLINGPIYVAENEQGVIYSAPDYATGVTYAWNIPVGATIVSGQGTKQITVNWGPSDGAVGLVLTGNTGCAVNSVSINVATIVEPSGPKYIVENFSNSGLPGWTKNDNAITYQATSNQLSVTYNVSSLKYIQYEMPKAVRLTNYGIIKLPIAVLASSAIQTLLLTFRDGNGNETIATNFEIKITKNDGVYYTYAYNFDSQWSLNNPAVNDKSIKSVRIYMITGQSSFKIGPIELYASKVIPESPTNLLSSLTNQGAVSLSWTDNTNATSFNLYRSNSSLGTYVKIKSLLKTSENPYVFTPTDALNYYKLSGVNSIGESVLSAPIEVVASITAIEPLDNSAISFYPNPSNGRIFIQSNGNPISDLRIYDSRGMAQSFNTVSENNLLIIEVYAFSNGVYCIVLNKEGKTHVAKIIIN